MATIVVEALVSASLELLLEKIVSGEFKDLFQSTKLDNDLLENLRSTLLILQAVLNDAEQKQIKDPAVKTWLVRLQHVVFDAEDLFDEVNTEALRCKLKAEKTGKRAKVRKFLSAHFKSSYGTINSEMQKLHIKLKDLVDKVHPLGLTVGVSSSVWNGTPTSSVAVDESSIYGRDNDRKKLKGFLLSDDAREGDGKIGVVSIMGMGGLGKTTLAKQLFNDPEVKKEFNLKGWAHISKDFDVLNLTKALLESITGESSKANFLDTLQVELQQSLEGKKFLLVLDDIWDVIYDVWNNLKDIFNVGETGSRIIITTRDERIALTMKTFLPIHNLERLGSDGCWSLLAKHAFGASNYQQCSNIEEIGREIAKKCDGLPLAAVALGGLLRTKLSPDDWNHVLKSNIWEFENTKVNSTLQPALLLSYHYLPGHLKRCFAYCAIFPKNYKFKKEMIFPLWIAEGLVQQPKSEKSWEKEAEEYFDELVSRSLIQRRSINGKEIVEMHDLMHDLATTVSYPYCVRLDEHKVVESLERVRHLSYNRNGFNSFNKFDILHGLKGLRTFLSLPFQDPWLFDDCMSDKVVGDLLLKMKHLHSLSLTHCRKITNVPTSIGKLIYLRYLNLSGTPIERLPSETCKLVNLQTLIVSQCSGLTELPKDMGKLVNLHSLDVSCTPIERLPSETCKLVNLQTLIVSKCSRLTELPEDVEKLVNLRNLDVRRTPLKEMPVQITKLKNLQTLSDFIVSKKFNGLKVGDLGKYPHLKGNLSISELQNVTDHSDASQANLEMKKQIEELILKWHHTAPSDSNSEIESGVLERLRPSTNLKRLTISGYGGTSFPNWLGDSSFGNMVYLEIRNCDNGSELPPLGQLGQLKELIITEMKSVKSIRAEFYGSGGGPLFQPFPSLETLSFKDMQEWEEWNLIGGTTIEFPSLRCLILIECPKLKGNIPTNLPSLTELQLYRCPLLVDPWSSDDNSNMSSSINDRENMKFIAHESLHNYTSLEYLQIDRSCYSMTSFTLGTFPVLKKLIIDSCEKLKSIVIAEDVSQQQSLSYLSEILIWNCDELESISFGGIGLGLSIPNLDRLWVSNCKKLRSLLEPMDSLVGLRYMELSSLPNLQSIGKDGFPINLRQLEIGSIGGDLWNTRVWERLTCLSKLIITSGDMLEALMKMEVPLLPTSLVTLHIYKLGDIECLDGKWLHHLTSLQELYIEYARNLKSLPEEGFPSSLSELSIVICPLLEERWQDKKGKEWSKIAHIPVIRIDGRRIN